MSDQWYYRMFDEEFGPMPFEDLKQLVEFGTISATDEVRSADSGQWIAAAEVDQLGLIVEPVQVTLDTSVEALGTDFELPTIKQGTDEWFCKLGDQELGPLTFNELSDYAENEQLAADDEVKLGEHGKWRRVGSIGRLMAVIPYKAVEKNIVSTPLKAHTPADEIPLVNSMDDLLDLVNGSEDYELESATSAPATNVQATYNAAYEDAKAKIAQSMVAQAEQNFKSAEEQAKGQIAWASAPNIDRNWWGWAGDIEFGPVEFAQVIGLAKSGQLKPNDLIRNGQFGQFGPSSNVPGLFNAATILARATEAFALAKSQAQAAVALALPLPTVPNPILNSSTMPVAPATNKIRPAISPLAAPKSDPPIDTSHRRDQSGSAPEIPIRTETARRSESTDNPRPPQHSRPTEPRPAAPRPSVDMTSMTGSHTSSISALSSSAIRPVVPLKLPDTKRAKGTGPSWISGVLGQLKEPKAIGSLAVIALVLLIVGWGFLPKSKAEDIKRYQSLKQILEEFRAKKNNPAELAALKTKATKTAKEMAIVLKPLASRDDVAKQCLLWASRDELPRMFDIGANAEIGEKGFASRLQEAAVELGLERRVAVSAVQGAPLPDD